MKLNVKELLKEAYEVRSIRESYGQLAAHGTEEVNNIITLCECLIEAEKALESYRTHAYHDCPERFP